MDSGGFCILCLLDPTTSLGLLGVKSSEQGKA